MKRACAGIDTRGAAWRPRGAPAALLVLMVLIVMSSGGCVVRYVDYTTFAAPPSDGQALAHYRIGPSDELLIRSDTLRALDGLWATVRPNGTIHLPGIGRIQAAGRTRAELAAALNAQTESRAPDPRITVRVARYASQRIYVRGCVAAPGPQIYNARNTVITTLTRAQPTWQGDPRRILVLAPTGDGEFQLRTTVDLQALANGDSGASDVVLRPGEIVHVPPHPLAPQAQQRRGSS